MSSDPTRRKQAQSRRDRRQNRDPLTQLQLLDQRLGEGVGAVKERARLEAQLGVSVEQITGKPVRKRKRKK